MITTTPTFATANANLKKQPIYVVVIDGYTRVFTSRIVNLSGMVIIFPNGDQVTIP